MAQSEEYGSVLDESASTMMENREERSDDEEDLEGLQSVAGCTCRSQCSRKLKVSENGKVSGCPCKGNGLLCGDNCTCGTRSKPCRNKAQPQPQPTDGGGPSRELLPSQISVEDMIDALDHETLAKVAKLGFFSRGHQLKDLIATVQSNSADPSQAHGESHPVPPFCVCGYCSEMPTDKESICCKERRICRSKSGGFGNICLDSDNLSTAIRSHANTFVFTPIYDNRAMRHMAYRQYVMWIHGHLGRGHRKVIPSCCVLEIRKHYPSPDGKYTGYKDK